MKIGLSRPYVDPGAPIPDVDMGAVGRMAEAAGFQWLSYGHHVLRPLNEPVRGPYSAVPYYQDPLIGAARAMALTKTLEVATGVLIVPMKHPVDVAKQVASLDQYGGGRFMLGVGVGGASRVEIEAAGGSWARRWDYTVESIQVMKGLWTEDGFSFKGDFFDIPPVTMHPRPARQPYPPVLLGGFSDNVLRRVGLYCEGWLPAYAGTRMMRPDGTDRTAPEHMKDGRATIERFAREAGRDLKHFEIGVILGPGDENREYVRIYEDAGADRIAFTLPEIASVQDAHDAIGRLADIVL